MLRPPCWTRRGLPCARTRAAPAAMSGRGELFAYRAGTLVVSAGAGNCNGRPGAQATRPGAPLHRLDGTAAAPRRGAGGCAVECVAGAWLGEAYAQAQDTAGDTAGCTGARAPVWS